MTSAGAQLASTDAERLFITYDVDDPKDGRMLNVSRSVEQARVMAETGYTYSYRVGKRRKLVEQVFIEHRLRGKRVR